MDYLIPEEVAIENGIREEIFIKFLEVHIKQALTTGEMIAEDTLRFRIQKNFGNVSENVYKVIIQELELTLK